MQAQVNLFSTVLSKILLLLLLLLLLKHNFKKMLNNTIHCFFSGCYDCNYAPSGYVKGFKDWAEGSAEVGYMRCALTSPADRFFLSKRPCLSGLCYIRQEENGSK